MALEHNSEFGSSFWFSLQQHLKLNSITCVQVSLHPSTAASNLVGGNGVSNDVPVRGRSK